MTPRARTIVLPALLLALLLGGALVGYRLLFEPAASPPAPAPAVAAPPSPPPPVALPSPPPAPTTYELADVDGLVEVRRDGTWARAASGATLRDRDAIRTGTDGRATLRSPGGDELVLRERVELDLDRLTTPFTELTLRRGKVKAEPGATTETFQISSAGARAIGRGGGRFTVYADPQGAVSVASEAGDVRVIAAGGEVTLGTRTQTYVPPAGKPSEPIPIPDEVFLSVAWPRDEVASTRVALRGKAAPGTVVLANGQEATVRADGTFQVKVPLREGANRVAVVAEGLDGKQATAKGEVEVNTKGPDLKADPSQLYKTPRPKP